jgi:hypothetical protein
MNPISLAELGVVPVAGLDLLGLYGVRRLRARETEGVRFNLLPPAQAPVDLAEWVSLFRGLYGMAAPWWRRALVGQPWVSLELWGEAGQVTPRCWVPTRMEPLVRLHLRTALPGVDVIQTEQEAPFQEPAARTRLSLRRDPLHPLGGGKADALRTVVSTLASADQAVVQLVISPDVGWQRRALKQIDRASAGHPTGIVRGVIGELVSIATPTGLSGSSAPAELPPSAKLQLPPTDKALLPCYRAEVRLRVSSPSRAQAKALMQALTSAFRDLDGLNALRPRRVVLGAGFDRALVNRSAPARTGLVLSAPELAHLYHLPVSSESLRAAPVRILPHSVQTATGMVLCCAEDQAHTPIRITQEDLRQHMHLVGPTGAGKSALLLHLALQSAESGRGLCVIDAKGDLVNDLLERLPEECADKVILIDPSRRDRPVGINVLECDDPEKAELVCDSAVTIFRKQFERFWGPRTDDLLRGALLTLLRRPGSTLCEVPMLLLQPAARARFTEGISDPIGLGPLWHQYERMSESQRLMAAGPVLNKLRSILLRPTVSNILGQSASTVDLKQAMDTGRIVLISLAKGLLGEETSQLLGSFLVARIWQAAMARADRPEARRPDFNLFLDEFQNYLHLPHTIDEVLVEARGYHLCLCLAHQHLSQLNRATRDALLANAHTRIVFQCGEADARELAREFEPHLGARELRNLQRFQVALRLCVGGRTEPPVTGVTLPPLPQLRDARVIVDLALQRDGRPRAEVEAEIRGRFEEHGLTSEEETA